MCSSTSCSLVGAAADAAPLPVRPLPTTVTVTLTPPSGPAMSGALVEMDDMFVTFRDASGTVRVVRRVPE